MPTPIDKFVPCGRGRPGLGTRCINGSLCRHCREIERLRNFIKSIEEQGEIQMQLGTGEVISVQAPVEFIAAVESDLLNHPLTHALAEACQEFVLTHSPVVSTLVITGFVFDLEGKASVTVERPKN